MTVEMLYCFIGGLIFGVLIGLFCLDFGKHDGVIHVSCGRAEDEPDKYLFEFNIPPEKIPGMKNVIFKVKLEDSQKQQPI